MRAHSFTYRARRLARPLLAALLLAGASACFSGEEGGSTGLSGLPGEVSNVTAAGDTTSSILVTWTAATGPIQGYRVAYAAGGTAPSDCSAAQVTEATQTTTSYTLGGIPDYTTYSFRVCAVNDNPVPDVSTGGTATGRSLALPPPNPSGLTSTVDSDTEVTLSWSSGGGSTTDYRISYQLGSTAPADCTSGSTVSESAISGTSYQVTRLSPGRLYAFRVCAINDNATPDESSGVTGTASAWTDTDFKRRRLLTFDNSAHAENLVNFPVLVALDSTRIDYSQTQNGGQDLRFYDFDTNNQLDHEIESWNEAGTSYVWVRVPQINSSSTTDAIWMYYGNATAPDGQDLDGTWSSAFRGVWHLNDAVPNMTDSSGNANTGTVLDNTFSVASLFANGLGFDGAGDYVQVNASGSFNTSNNVLIEGWFRPDNLFDNTALTTFALFEKFLDVSNDVLIGLAGDDYLRDEVPIGALFLKLEKNNNRVFAWTNNTSWNAGQWYHFAVQIDTGNNLNTNIYVDGVDDTDPGIFMDTGSHANLDFNANLGIGGGNIDTGNFAVGTQRFFQGRMEEVRFSEATRSANWIAAQYLSMTDGMITYGSEQSVP